MSEFSEHDFIPSNYSGDHVELQCFPEERQRTLLRELGERVMFYTDSGQAISGRYVNRDFWSNPLGVVENAFLGASNTAEQLYELAQQAITLPNNPHVMLDMPGHGESDRLTSGQRLETLTTGKVSLIGYAHAEAVRNYFPNAYAIFATGASLGARALPDFAIRAGQLDMKPFLVAGFDPAGFDSRRSICMAKAFFVSEHKKQRFYHVGDANARLDEFYRLFKADLGSKGFSDLDYDASAVFKKDPGVGIFIVARSPLASDTGWESLSRSLDANPEMAVSFTSGGHSNICRLDQVAPKAAEIQCAYPSRFRWDVLPNDSHSMSIAPQQPRLKKRLGELVMFSQPKSVC